MPIRQPFIKPQELFLSSLWWNQLKDTASEAEVVSLTREFLAAWTPEQLAGVPQDARPGRISNGDDIRELALNLKRANFDFVGEELDGLLLEKMSAFFSEAALHLSRLAEPFTVPARQQTSEGIGK